MGDGLRARGRDAAAAFAAVARNGSLARAQLSFGAAWAAEWGFTVALGVVAFQDAGAGAVGIVAVARLLPAALLAPFLTAGADRVPRERICIRSCQARAAATAGAAAILATDGPLWAVYGLAVLATIAVTPYRAAHSALLPSLCRTTTELTSSNVVRGMLDSLSAVAGPFGVALLVAATDDWVAFAAAAASALAAALLLEGLRYEAPPRLGATAAPRPLHDALDGVRTIAGERNLALIVGLAMTQTILRGAINVFLVVVAIDLLEMGASGVGVLTGAIGVGAVAGSLAASLLVGDRRMAQCFGVAVALWGAPMCLMGAAPAEAVALAALASIGLANALVDISCFTVMPRLVPDEVLARVYGAFESLLALGIAGGSLLAPVGLDVLGTRGALAVFGALGPAVVAVSWRRLQRLDTQIGARDAEADLLRATPLLRPLPVPTIEALSRALEPVGVAAGEDVVRAGDVGRRYYVIASGEVEILDGSRHIRTMRRGEGFGEIALLRDVPRTMTARAQTDVQLLALGREEFVPAVSGYTASLSAATIVTERWLAGDVRDGEQPLVQSVG
jgi:hypothetical protein